MGKMKDIISVYEICLLGRPVFMKHTYPSSAYVYREDFSVSGAGYIMEIIFDIMGSDDEVWFDNSKIGEIHGYLINIDRLERDGVSIEDEFSDDHDYEHVFWLMHDGRFGQNAKSNNIFFIERIFIDKTLRHNKVASKSLLLLPRVLDEQFNAAVGYIVAKPSPILDKPKLQKKDLEIYQRLCPEFWSRLGFSDMDGYKYYNINNDFVEESMERLSKYKLGKFIDMGDKYCCRFCDVKVFLDKMEIHVMEYNSETLLTDEEFALWRNNIFMELKLDKPVEEWKWIFYGYPGIAREFVDSNFVPASILDDSFYVRMLDYYGSFVGTP